MSAKVSCLACGMCCNKHWLLKLTSNSEIKLFEDQLIYGEYIWTDQCKFLKNNKCTNHINRPQKCKEYFCEKHFTK